MLILYTAHSLSDATGIKQSKTVKAGPTILSTQHYCAGLEYQNSELEAVYHANGRVYNTNSQDTSVVTLAWRYEYTLTDHLGNMRVTFYDSVGVAAVLQEEHYYPFGLRMNGSWLDGGVGKNEYGYNGKELNRELNLNWNDYGARWYDAAVGRFWQVDPLADQMTRYSPYNYAFDNPMRFIDPDGRSPDDWIKKTRGDKTYYFYDANINSQDDFDNSGLGKEGFTYLGGNHEESTTVGTTEISVGLMEDGNYYVTSSQENLDADDKSFTAKFNMTENMSAEKMNIDGYGETQVIEVDTYNAIENNENKEIVKMNDSAQLFLRVTSINCVKVKKPITLDR